MICRMYSICEKCGRDTSHGNRDTRVDSCRLCSEAWKSELPKRKPNMALKKKDLRRSGMYTTIEQFFYGIRGSNLSLFLLNQIVQKLTRILHRMPVDEILLARQDQAYLKDCANVVHRREKEQAIGERDESSRNPYSSARK